MHSLLKRREGKGTVHERQTESPEVFDRGQAMEATCGDKELLREIVGIFLEDFPSMMDALRKAVAKGDFEAARGAAHAVKGSVAVLGANALSAAAREAEDRARAGDKDGTRRAFVRVEEEAKRLAPVLEELLAG
jgi:HPt (histidine-containing phosphotransfer) domain-containing protein